MTDIIYPERPVGTKLRWMADNQNYRIAVFTKKGLLEVKSCNSDVPSYTMTYYYDEIAWKNSLPKYGMITIEEFKSPIEKKAEKPLSYLNDASRLRELQKRFSPHNRVIINHSNGNCYLSDRTSRSHIPYSKMLLIVDGETHEISYKYKHIGNKLYYTIFNNNMKKSYDSFKDIHRMVGSCLNEKGQPTLSVMYRNQRIHLGHLF